MSVLVVGSLAFDTIETPLAVREDVLGGSASFCAYAAGYFSPVRLVGVVGEDWPDEYTKLFNDRGVDTAGLQMKPGQQTFRWHGRYLPDWSDRETVGIQLNAYGDFDPVVPEQFQATPYVFLANAIPHIQLRVLDQIQSAKIILADTTDLWIAEYRADLLRVLARVDGLVLNENEAKQLTGEQDLVTAGRAILSLGPRLVVVKQGENGALVLSADELYELPAFPIQHMVDPTGAGDSFAGGLIGYLAEADDTSPAALRKAIVYGILIASFTVEEFSLDHMKRIERTDIDRRMAEYQVMFDC